MTQRVLFAQMLPPGVDGQVFQPAAEFLRFAYFVNVTPGLQKSLLRQIICQHRVTAASTHEVTNPCLSAPHQLLTSDQVAGTGEATESGAPTEDLDTETLVDGLPGWEHDRAPEAPRLTGRQPIPGS